MNSKIKRNEKSMTRKFFFLTKILEKKVKKKKKSFFYVCAFYFTFLKSINIESKSKVITIKKQLAKKLFF